MAEWHHRAKGIALVAAGVLVAGLVVARNPEAIGLGVEGLIVFGVLAMLAGLAWLFLTAVSED